MNGASCSVLPCWTPANITKSSSVTRSGEVTWNTFLFSFYNDFFSFARQEKSHLPCLRIEILCKFVTYTQPLIKYRTENIYWDYKWYLLTVSVTSYEIHKAFCFIDKSILMRRLKTALTATSLALDKRNGIQNLNLFFQIVCFVTKILWD